MCTNGETVGEQRTMMAIQDFCEKVPEIQLRDLFAMSALNGLLACQNTNGSADEFAFGAYRFADAMILARRKK